uniref:Uncharacterized protein n=1 Tax=Trypanosoma vivax (strain Y486) TaxID=1055687 RepID=G0UB84_TRYVY|nr:conserved hypothetical protein [Trypanosoma vivax Y486]
MRGCCYLLGGLNIHLLLDVYRGRCNEPVEPHRILDEAAKPTLLVSACMLGQPVSYRGKSSRCAQRCTPAGFILDFLYHEHQLVNCIGIGPEMDLLGMPAPRPPLRLVQSPDGGSRYAVTAERAIELPLSPLSVLKADKDGAEQRLGQRHPRLGEELLVRGLADVDGCVLKSRSPSCGVGDARLYGSSEGGKYTEVDGLFVEGFIRPAAVIGGVSMPLATERQLFFDYDHGARRSRIGYYGVLTFVGDVLRRFSARRSSVPSSVP